MFNVEVIVMYSGVSCHCSLAIPNGYGVFSIFEQHEYKLMDHYTTNLHIERNYIFNSVRSMFPRYTWTFESTF